MNSGEVDEWVRGCVGGEVDERVSGEMSGCIGMVNREMEREVDGWVDR